MVKLSLSSPKGTGARVFPHAGFLALTPLRIEGVVRTRLDDDRKPVLASDIFVAVRCYEARVGRAGVSHSNLLVDYAAPLWAKPPHEPWAEVGDGEWPFKLVLPPKIALAGRSTAHFQEYRVFWRIEAVLNHIPMMGVGHKQVKTYDLPLIRYDPGEALAPPTAAWAHANLVKHASTFSYLINAPPFPLGPMDLVPVSLKFKPADPGVRLHSVALAVERRLEFNDPPFGTRSVTDDTSLSSTTNLLDRGLPSPPPRGASKVVTSIITSAEAADVSRDEHGTYAKTITLQVPSQKSASHWAVGETMRTALVTLRFFLRVKATVYMPHGTVETVDLGERELCLVSTNESQRRLATTKYNEAVERARSRSRDTGKLPSPPPSPTTPLTASSAHTKGSAKAKGARRPHTSAGPRDAAREVARGASRRTAQNFRDLRTRSRPHAAAPKPTASTSSEENGGGSDPEQVRAWEDELERIETRSRWRTVVGGSPSPTARSAPAVKTFFASPTRTDAPLLPAPSTDHLTPPDSVQAWEEELERIAAQSRRRSVQMLGFNAERRTRPRIDTAADMS